MRNAIASLFGVLALMGVGWGLWTWAAAAPQARTQRRPAVLSVSARTSPVLERPGSAVADAPPTHAGLGAGRQVTVELSEPPATAYLAAWPDDNDAFYRKLVTQVSRGRAVYDPDLGRAAREFVFQYTEFGSDPPSDVRDFLLAGSGAIAGDTVFQHLRTTSEAEESLRKAIATVVSEPPSGTGDLHVGVGEIYMTGADLPRHIGVVGTRLPLRLDPMPRRAELGTVWRMSGRLVTPYTGLEALVLRPGGSIESLKPEVQGDLLTLDVAVGDRRGTLQVQLIGEGPSGPGKLVQVQVEVGQDPPRRFTTRIAPDEGGLQTADQAAQYAFALVNADRARHGVPTLLWDDKLAAVARDHSADMRDNGFFGHRSPTTGLHTQRLEGARYRAVASSENLAHNTSIAEAQAGLMDSLGHRRNMLDPKVTHLGIGVVGEEGDDGDRRWWVTQIFSKPVEDLDVSAAATEVLRRVTELRAKEGLTDLQPDSGLDSVAAQAADAALQGELDGVSSRALDRARARGLLKGKLRAWAALVPELDALDLPESAKAASARRIGVGVAQDRRSLDGRVSVVLLVGD